MQHSQKCVLFATEMHKYHTHLVLHKSHTTLAHTHMHAYARTHTHLGAYAWAHTRTHELQLQKQKNI